MIKPPNHIGYGKNSDIFTARNRVKFPSRCATVIAARHQSGTQALSTDTIQRRVDQIIKVLQQHWNFCLRPFLALMGVLFLYKKQKIGGFNGDQKNNCKNLSVLWRIF